MDAHESPEPEVIEATAIPTDGTLGPRRIGFPKLAWALIIGLVSLIILLPSRLAEKEVDEPLNLLAVRIMEVQAQYIVGTAQLLGSNNDNLYESVEPLDTGPAELRLRFIPLAGELAGADEALERLAELRRLARRDKVQLDASQRETLQLLETLYTSYAEEEWDASPLNARQRQRLLRDLGWFGSLALHPAKSSDREARSAVVSRAVKTMTLVVAGFAGAAALGLSGLIGAVTVAGLGFTGRLSPQLGTPHVVGGIYAETFACWMLMFLLTSAVVAFVGGVEQPLVLNIAVSTLSLLALAWPRIRGVRWKELFADIGLTRGRGVIREVAWGLVCYVSALPLVFLAVLLLMFMLWLQSVFDPGREALSPAGGPNHPIIQWLVEASYWDILQVFILASVLAPLVEEVFFRGVLYRHLRNLTLRWRVAASVTFSALGNSLIFAAIHPQGWLGVPMLTALAVAFSLAREWRGSLIAPMIAHALNNGLVTMLVISLVG